MEVIDPDNNYLYLLNMAIKIRYCKSDSQKFIVHLFFMKNNLY